MYTITVTSLADSGTGSLREAIAFANSYTGIDEIQIVFDESLTGKTIYLESDLPVVSTDCAIIGNGVSWSEYSLSTTASVELTDLEFPQLILTGIASVSSQNVILTSQDAIRLEAWSSGFADFSGIVTTADNAYAVVDSWVGDLNNLVLPELPECMEGGYRINVPVTNLNDEGAGSLRAAILLANSYIGEGEIHIIIDELLAGQSMSLTYELPTITRSCHIEAPAEGISISSVLYIGAETYLRNLSASQVVLTASGSLKAENVTLTAREAIRLVDWGGETDFSGIRATAQNAYVLLHGNLYDATLTTLPESFAGGYQCGDYYNGGSLYIAQGSTVTLEDGVAVNITASNSLHVSGTLKAEYEESASAIFSNSSFDTGCLYIENGGKVLLTNANIKDVDVYVRDGSFQMNGGSFEGYNYEMWGERAGRLTINSSSMATLSNVEVSVPIINDGGYLEMDNINSTSSIEINGESLLDDVTCTQLIVNDGSVTTSEGKKVYLASYIPFVFGNAFDGAISDFLSSFDWEITSTQARVYLRQCDLGKVVLSELPEQLSSGYVGSVVLSEGETANLNDKDMKSVDVENNGTLTLSRCQTNNVSNNGSLTLEDVSVSGCVISKGTLVMEGSEVSSYIRLHGNASLDGVSCTQLQVYNGSSVSSGEKGVTLTLEDAFTIASDFVGNIGEWLNSFKWSVTSDEACVYLNGCDLSKLALTRLPEPLKGGYDGYVYVYDDDELQLSNQFWTCRVYNYGKLVVKDAEIGQVANGGMLELENVKVDGHITSRISKWDDLNFEYTAYFGKLNLKNVVISDYVGVAEEACLDNVVCSYLEVGDSSAVCIGEHGIRLTGGTLYASGEMGTWPLAEDVAFVLTSSFEGDIAEWLNSFEWEVDNADAGIYLSNCDLSKVTLSTLPESLSGGYHGSVTVPAGKEISLYDIESSSLYINNDGSLTLEKSIIHSVDNSCYVSMIGGKIARNHSENEYISGAGNVSNSGTMTLEDVSVEANSVSNSGTMTLENVSVEAYTISNSGTMSITDCDVDTRYIYLYSNSELFAENVVFGDVSVDIYSSLTRIVGSDLSRASIKIMGTPGDESLIDLSGNYWGTTDLTEIWAKIDGDKSRVVINDIMLASPPRVFTLTKVSTDWLKIADTAGQLTLNFNREVDAGSVSMESLGLCREDGSVVSIKEYIVEGKSVTLVFDTLPVGQYSLQITNGLTDTSGNTYSMPSGFENGITYEVYDSSINTPPRLLLVLPNSTLPERFRSVDLFFNQILDADSITVDKVHVFAASGEEIAITNFYETETSGRTCYRVEFDTVTETGTYAVTVDASVRNEYGVEMTAPFEQNIYVASPDLQLADEISFTSATPGRYATITYTVENRGDGAAVGSWTDSVYLCRSEAWDDSEAILFGRVTRSKENLASGATYSASVSGILPGLGDERYYVFVRTDEASRVSESNEQNNDRRASDPMELIVPELSVGVSLDDSTTSANELLYYCYTAEVSGTLAFALKNADGKICVWEAEGDASVSLGRVVKSENEQTLYFSAEAGQKYYISVKPNRTGQFAMELRETSFSLVSVSVNSVSAGHTTTMSLVGTELTEGMNVYLEDAQGNRYDATNVVVKNPVEATVQFELPEGLEPGMPLTLHAENPGGELAVLETPLNVATYGDVVDLSFDEMDGWSYQRVGYVWRSHLNVENARGADLDNAIILVTDTAEDFAMYYSYAEGSIRDRSALMFLGGAGDSSPNQLLAGEKDKLDIFVKNYRSSEGCIEAHVFDPTDTTAIAPGMWEQIASALRPATCEDETWTAWWSNMQPRIGTTVADFVSFVREMQQVSGKNTGSSLADLVDDIIRNHGEYAPSAGVWGALTDADGEGVQNAIVELYRITDGERELVSSLLTGEYGYFCFGKLEQGAQYELVCSESFMLGGNMVNSVTFVQEGITTEQRWEMPPTASVKITISGITGQLSEEAAVYLTSADGRMVLLTYRNDAWVADGVLPGDYTLSAVEDGYSFAEKIVTVTGVSAENTFTISATRVVTLQGRLLNADGSKGVEDVCVALCQNGQVVAMAQTDESGHYVLSYIREGDYELRLDDAAGRLLSEITANDEQIDDILLNQGHTVSGSLRGAALGSTVSLYEGDVCKYTTVLKADGTYVFSGVAEGEYRLLVNDEEIDPFFSLVLPEGENKVEIPEKIALQGVRIVGTVSDMAAETVMLYYDEQIVAVSNVDASGSFEFIVGAPGVYTLQAFNVSLGCMSMPETVEVQSAMGEELVTLVGASGGVQLTLPTILPDSATVWIYEFTGQKGNMIVSFNGHELSSQKNISGIAEGEYILIARNGNYYLEKRFVVQEGRTTSVEIDGMSKQCSVSVSVDANGALEPGECAIIYFCNEETKEIVTSRYLTDLSLINIEGVPVGRYRVVVIGDLGKSYATCSMEIKQNVDNVLSLAPEILSKYIFGFVHDVDQEFLENTSVVFLDDSGCVVSSVKVEDDGSFRILVTENISGCYLSVFNSVTGQNTTVKLDNTTRNYDIALPLKDESDIFFGSINVNTEKGEDVSLLQLSHYAKRASIHLAQYINAIQTASDIIFKGIAPNLVSNRASLNSECCSTDNLREAKRREWNAYCKAVDLQESADVKWKSIRGQLIESIGTLGAIVLAAAPLSAGLSAGLAYGVVASGLLTTAVSLYKELRDMPDFNLVDFVRDSSAQITSLVSGIGEIITKRAAIMNVKTRLENFERSLEYIKYIKNTEVTYGLDSGIESEAMKQSMIRSAAQSLNKEANALIDAVGGDDNLLELVGKDQYERVKKIYAQTSVDSIDNGMSMRELETWLDDSRQVKADVAISNIGKLLKVLDALGKIGDALSVGFLIRDIVDLGNLIDEMNVAVSEVQNCHEIAKLEYDRVVRCIDTQGDDCKPDPDAELPHKNFQSYDPNDIYGPEGYGAQNWIGRQEMMFEVVCENIPEENIAHAAMVTIKQQIDAAYDYSTFRLGDMMIAGNYIQVDGDVQSYKARHDWTSTLGVWVDVNAVFDADTGLMTWEFVAIDPETGYVVADPFTGLLAPNYNPPEGDGGVKYYVTPKETTASGTVMQSQAEIIFDFNEPIDTPLLKYTLDGDNPVAVVQSVSESAAAGYLLVRWGGTDVGSGVKSYDVYVSVDGGEWQLWQDDISFDRALYAKLVGEHSYAFYAVAMDYAGNAEAVTEVVSAEASLVSTHTDAESSLTVNSVQAVRAGDELTLSIAFSEQAVCADWAAALLVYTSAQNIDLSTGTFRYDATTHVLTWVGTVAGVPDGAQATVRLTDGAVTDANGLPFGSSVPAYTAPIELAGVVGSTYAAPALVDYNGDGLLDVLVGEVAENGKGRIRIYLNEGTAEVASFASFIYASTAEDTPIELAATGCQGAIVRFADITGDGKDEMVVGLADGTIRIFTAAEGGHWADSGELSCSVGGESETVDVGTRAAIEFVDANGDGRTDLLVGTGDGNVLLYLNTSAEGAAAFDAGRYLHDAAGRIDVGSRATVATGDFDGDGLWDMLLGTADGTVLFYRNEGSTGTPLFGAAETVFAGDALLDMSSETNRVRIDTGDLNGDGIDDLVVGQSGGKVKLLYGTDGADVIGETDILSSPDITAPVVTLNEPEVKKIADGRIAVTFSWSCSEPAVYTLTVDGKEYSVRGATRYTLELADGEHVYSVKATDGAGLTGTAEGSFAMDATAPAVVQGVQAITGESGVAVSWNVVEDAASYTLEYATKPDFSDAKSVTGITGASYALTALPGTGTLYVRVASADAAGNVSAWSAVAESALDITAPGAVQGLEVMAHGTSARLSWDAVSDESGIAGYRIEYAVDGDFTKAQSMQVNSTEATFYTLLAGAAYQWRVAAVDGAGNVGEWTVGEAFRTGTAEPEDDSPAESREIIMTVPSGGESHSTTRVNGWVGFDDPADYYCFTAKGEGAYAISLDAAVLGTQVYLSVGTLDDKGNFAAEKKLLVAPGSAAAALGGIALESGEKCYIRVESYDKGLGRYNGEYSLSVNAEVADSAWVTDNNSPDKATMLKPGDAADAALSGWVGMGDAVDYYCFELTKPAELSLVLGELDSAVKVKLLREERDGGVSQVMSRSVKASRGLDHTLSLTSGTYFVEVASYDNGAGRYNTTYALELEKEEANGNKEFAVANG